MATPLPYLRGTSGGLNAQVLYPFTRTVSFFTRVTTNTNGSEQRWASRPPLYEFQLPMNQITGTDKASWLSTFSSEGGRFGQDLQLTLGATTYSNLTILHDDLSVENQSGNIYNQNLNLRQVQNGSWTPPTPGTSYPTLSFGTVAERPFVQSSCFYTGVNDNPYGPRFAWKWYGGGLTNFPTTYLRKWQLSYPLLSTADITTLETFFIGQQGKLGSFSFTDPLDNTTYTHVRFDQDTFSVRYLTLNQNSTNIVLVQTNGS